MRLNRGAPDLEAVWPPASFDGSTAADCAPSLVKECAENVRRNGHMLGMHTTIHCGTWDVSELPMSTAPTRCAEDICPLTLEAAERATLFLAADGTMRPCFNVHSHVVVVVVLNANFLLRCILIANSLIHLHFYHCHSTWFQDTSIVIIIMFLVRLSFDWNCH